MKKKILWVDDEISAFSAHISYLEKEGYSVVTETNGDDAVETFTNESVDLVLLDQNMPGMSGIDTLAAMKRLKSSVPIVMVTKNEDTDTVKSAFGNMADGFIVKPCNIPQLSATVIMTLDKKSIVEQTVVEGFNRDYGRLSQEVGLCRTFDEWKSLYAKIVEWELKLPNDSVGMLLDLKTEANAQFCKFVKNNYLSWVGAERSSDAPHTSDRLLSDVVKPCLMKGEKVALVVIDNFRLDQWEVIRPDLEKDFDIKTDAYCSILPTSTAFSRNAIFSGLLPADIKKLYPQYWVDDASEAHNMNEFERELLADYFKRQRLNRTNSYYKVLTNSSAENYIKGFAGSKGHPGYKSNDLNALVFNFADALSHLLTANQTVKDLAPDDSAYRNLTRLWFVNGVMHKVLLLLRDNGFKIILTTDHGTIRVHKPIEVAGPNLNSNPRYKAGIKLKYKEKEVFALQGKDIQRAGLPIRSIADEYIFAPEDGFFVYNNNKKGDIIDEFSDSLQHGGVSMEEMILPLVTLSKKE